MKTFMFIVCIVLALVDTAMFFVSLYLCDKYENNAFIMGGFLLLFVAAAMWTAVMEYGKEE